MGLPNKRIMALTFTQVYRCEAFSVLSKSVGLRKTGAVLVVEVIVEALAL